MPERFGPKATSPRATPWCASGSTTPESGETAPTYAYKGRYYVQGSDNERYTIRISNPTGNRVEAVVSVDGLDTPLGLRQPSDAALRVGQDVFVTLNPEHVLVFARD